MPLATGDVTLLPADEVVLALGVDPGVGLSTAEVAARRDLYGLNELRSTPPEPAWRRFLRQFADPLIYLLLAAIVISIIAWVVEGGTGLPVDAIVIAVIVVANAVIGFIQENRAERAVAALATMTATHSTVLRDGFLGSVPSAELVPGDVLVLAEGDAVGADSRLLTASSLLTQEASLTGESEATQKDPSALAGPVSIGDQTNMVFKGTSVARGVGRAVVTTTGMDTEMGRIATLLDETEAGPTPLQVEIGKISQTLGLLVVVIAVVVMLTTAWVNRVSTLDGAVEILLMGVSLAVAAVPEGLPAILSLVLAIGVQAMARRNAVMKDLHSVEALGSVSVICSDKTGTLTRNEMTLREVVTASGRVTLGGTGYAPVGEVLVTGDVEPALAEARRALVAGSVANDAQLRQAEGTWQIQGDPTEAAFLVGAHKLDGAAELVSGHTRAAEVPFTSERKMMSVLSNDPDGRQVLYAKGAPDVLLERCIAEQVGDDASVPLSDGRRGELASTIESLGAEGYRTLGVAWRSAPLDDADSFGEQAERDLILVGVVALLDPPREEAVAAIAEAHRAGIRTVMITGDHPVTAARIAADLGIVGEGRAVVMTGREVDDADDEALARAAVEARVYARVAPEHKLRVVDALQAGRHVVAMTGDGVNDAPALKSADIGVAMGINGTAVTKEAGKMILGDDNFATIVAAVRQGRVIFDNIRKFMRYLLSSNMGEIATVFLGVTLGGVIGLADPSAPGRTVVPLLATQILWINLVTDSGPALAMGVDPEIDDVMARPPRRFDDHIIDRHMWQRILGIGGLMGVLCLAAFDLTLPGGLVGGLEHLAPVGAELATSRTTVFTALVVMQLANALNSRSDLASVMDHLFTNAWLWMALAGALLAQVAVVYLPVLQSAFGTAPLGWAHWSVAGGAGLLVILAEEAVKAVRRARGRSTRPAPASSLGV